MNQTSDESIRAQLQGLTPSGDLLDLARQLREVGVESLLICEPGGRITRVLTDRQIAQMATFAVETTVPAVPPVAPLPAQAGAPVPTGLVPTVPRTRHPADHLTPARSVRNASGAVGSAGRPVDR